MKYSFEALGTTWWIEIFQELTNKTRDEVSDFVTGFVSAYENNYSRFKSDSFISILNRERELQNPTPEFIRLLEYGKRLYLRSDTHFNLLTGHILESKGYDADYTFKSTSFDKTAGNPVTDLTITPELITLQKGNIDLGGFGKGYLIDLLAEHFKDQFGIEQFLINGGGDMYATHNDNKPIAIHLEHPTKPGTIVATTTLFNVGFAASSPHKRVWKNETGTHTHIIAETIHVDATFIKATSAADADAFATTSLMMNKQQLEELTKTEKLSIALFDAKTEKIMSTKEF